MFGSLTQGQKIIVSIPVVCGMCASFLFVYYSYTQPLPESLIVENSPRTDPGVCEEFLKRETIDEGVVLPLSCDVSLSTKGPVVTIAISKEGFLSVSHDQTSIFSPQDEWFREATFLDFDETKALPMSIVLQDVTYDGYLDIVLSPYVGAYQRGYDYFPYDPERGFFKGESLLTATSAFVDTEARTIESYAKGRGIGDIYTNEVFHYEDGAYVLIREVKQDEANILDENGDVLEVRYLYTVRERKGGEMIDVERKYYLEEDLY